MVLSEFVKVVDGWPTIEIGRMRHPITIQAYGPLCPPQYDDNGMINTWTTVAEAMVAMNPVRGIDMVRTGQTTSMVFIPVAMWFQPGIVGGMRLVTEYGDTFVIQAVSNVMQLDVVLVLSCLALDANSSN